MIRMIVAPLFVVAAAAGAQTCEYKPVMTDAEIEACRHPRSTAQAPTSAGPSGRSSRPSTPSPTASPSSAPAPRDPNHFKVTPAQAAQLQTSIKPYVHETEDAFLGMQDALEAAEVESPWRHCTARKLTTAAGTVTHYECAEGKSVDFANEKAIAVRE